ncbi:MAG: trigger factor [Bacteriovoracaceae bacterium]|nr:trigger factor [Bacteriovoracaceae bacterium]
MNITIEPINSASAKVKVLVPAAQVSERMNSYFAGLAKKARVPGFRPGKAPKDVVKKMYGSESSSEIAERLVSEFVIQAIQEHKLELIMPPRLLATDLPDESKDFSFEVEVELKPKVPELNLKGIEIEGVTPKPIAEEEINNQIENLRDADAPFSDVKESRGAKNGDSVVIKFEGALNGVKSPELAAESHEIVLGNKQFLPEFEAAIVGMKVGEKKTFEMKFPENYHAEHLKNQNVKFDLEILGLKEKVLAPLDDAFAQTINPEFKTVADLKADIRKELEAQRERMKISTLRDQIGDKLVEKHPFEVSKRQVESMAASLAEEAHHMMHKMGVEHKEDEDHFNALQASSMKKAQRDIQLSYILQKISRDKSFEVSPEDIEKRFEETAKKTGFSLSQIKQYYAGKDEDVTLSRIDRLKIDILDEKSLDYALSAATIKLKGQ